MACYHPMLACRESGFQVQAKTGKWSKVKVIKAYDEACEYMLGVHQDTDGYRTEYFLVSCGQCVGCMLDRSREWADRCALESKMHKHSYFITLTYNDDRIPLHDGVPTLSKKHLQDFIKRWRRRCEYSGFDDIRYIACGEYGSRSARPHYHLCVFGDCIPDLKYVSTKNGFPNFDSDFIRELWPFGLIQVNEFSWETAAYVARYTVKKLKMDDEERNELLLLGVQPEFLLMSRRPGIGYSYWKAHHDELLENDSIFVNRSGGVYSAPIPEYFDYLFEKEGVKSELLEKRSIGRAVRDSARGKTNSTLGIFEQRKVDEAYKSDQILALARKFDLDF